MLSPRPLQTMPSGIAAVTRRPTRAVFQSQCLSSYAGKDVRRHVTSDSRESNRISLKREEFILWYASWLRARVSHNDELTVVDVL